MLGYNVYSHFFLISAKYLEFAIFVTTSCICSIYLFHIFCIFLPSVIGESEIYSLMGIHSLHFTIIRSNAFSWIGKRKTVSQVSNRHCSKFNQPIKHFHSTSSEWRRTVQGLVSETWAGQPRY